MDELRSQIGEIVQDYADGLLDDLDEAVDAILDLDAVKERLNLTPIRSMPIGPEHD